VTQSRPRLNVHAVDACALGICVSRLMALKSNDINSPTPVSLREHNDRCVFMYVN